MPTSYAQTISPLMEIVLQLRPASVLDVGMGSGKYGVLCREYCDQWLHGKLERRTRIDGIEGHPAYVGDLHRAVYDRILLGDARELIPALEHQYDLVLMIDMFEHLTPEDGRAMLAAPALEAASVLVSVPAGRLEQGAVYGNEFERHRAHYSRASLNALGFTQVWRVRDSWVALRCPRRVVLRRLLLRYAFDGLYFPHLIAALRRKVSRVLSA